MHKGLQPAMKEYVVEKEARDLIERFKIARGKDQDPHDTIRPLLGNLLAFVVSLRAPDKVVLGSISGPTTCFPFSFR